MIDALNNTTIDAAIDSAAARKRELDALKPRATLVESLRFLAMHHDGPKVSRVPSNSLVEAADRIEELSQAVEAALNIVDGDGAPPRWDWMREALARARG